MVGVAALLIYALSDRIVDNMSRCGKRRDDVAGCSKIS